jgi:hypothetical protein
MVAAEGIEDTTGGNEALGEITKYVNVKTVLAGKETLDGSIDGGRCLLLSLLCAINERISEVSVRGEEEKAC